MLIFYEPALVVRSAGPRPALKVFISFPHQAADFLINPWKSAPSAWFPYWDEFVYTLLKSCSKLIPHALYCSGSKVRLIEFYIDISHELFKLVQICLLIINGYYEGPGLLTQA